MVARVWVLGLTVTSFLACVPESEFEPESEPEVFVDFTVEDLGVNDAHGCADLGSESESDGGVPQDSGPQPIADAGPEDLSDLKPDASFADAGLPDTGRPDAGSFDAGSSQDAGSVDSGMPMSCSVAAETFSCVDAQSCGAPDVAYQGRCGGSGNVCCAPEPDCSVRGAPGYCKDVSLCGGVTTRGLCPGPANIRCCTDPAEACDETAAPTPHAGAPAEVSYDARCPAGMVWAGGYCIDRYEAALIQTNGVAWSPYINPGSTSVRAVSLENIVPQGYISGRQARDACNNAGKRLCTENEWERACRGASNHTYPYGNTRQPGLCNDARSQHPAIEYFGRSDDSVFSMLDNRCINQLPDGLDLTGQNTGCISPVGAFDMMGNLHEWVSDTSGVFRGGYYVDTFRNGNGCTYRTRAHGFSYSDYSTGFRCCANPL